MKILTVYCGLIVTSVSVMLLVYLIILTKKNFVSNTSIELNIIGKKQIISVSNKSDLNKYDDRQNYNVKKKRKYHVPKFMLELYKTNKREGYNFSRPDVVRSLIPKHAGPYFSDNQLEDLSHNHLLIFDLPTSNDDEEFLSAELKILTLVEITSRALSGVERILKLSVYDDASKTIVHHQESHIYHINNTWLSFNLTQPVTEILNKNSDVKYLKILITITSSLEFRSSQNNLQLSLMPIADNFQHDYPVLLLSYSSANSGNDFDDKEANLLDNEVGSKRSKRNIEEDYEEETNKLWGNENERKLQLKKLKKLRNACKKKSLYVDFAEINYDEWIVQPTGYEAYQCQGRCFYPVADHLDPTKHAIIQALLHSVAPSKVSRTCCVPTKLTSISILYVDDKSVLTYRYAYKDMVVVECGCR